MLKFLIALIFISKISLAFLGFPVFEWSIIIFQKGLHPILHALILFISTGYLFWFYKKTFFLSYHPWSGYRRFIKYAFILICFLSLAQWMQSNFKDSFFVLLSTLISLYILIFIYGFWIPKLLPLKDFIDLIGNITAIIVLLSFIFWIFNFDFTFKGGRFIGIMKHIPHMVSVATLAFFIWGYKFFNTESKIKSFIIAGLSFWVLILTGTRSALLACLVGTILFFILQPIKSISHKFWRVSFGIIFITGLFFFSKPVFDFTEDVILGRTSLMNRQAQDGIESRLQEVERGLDMFAKNSLLGLGLLSKYNTGNEDEAITDRVEKYNAHKDPHNFFISAGVIGGWSFLIYSSLGIFLLLFYTLRSLNKENGLVILVAVYLLCHWPILIIYHVHLSVGGIADRIYWLMAGYLFIKSPNILSGPQASDKSVSTF